MQTFTFVALLLVASQAVLAEQPQEVSAVQPVQPVEHHVVVQQAPSGQVSQSPSSSATAAGSQSSVSVVQPEVVQPVPVGVEQHVAAGQPQPAQAQPQAGAVYHYAAPVVPQQVQQAQQQQYGQAQQVSYYSPAAGMVQVMGQDQQQHYPKPAQYSGAQVVAAEQYGQPESASIPANYKPFGSWGLYIGGNPADGYYTNYYKSLANTVEKQTGAGVQPVAESAVGVGSQGPRVALRQASGGSLVVGGGSTDFYPFDNTYYTPADLNSGVPRFVSPVQAGSQTYGTPSASYEPGSSAVLSYAADNSFTTKGSRSTSQVQQQQAKGYQQRLGYVYSPVVQASGQQQQQQQAQPQVVAYPVPVGSQIVGSQPGVEGAFQPYGLHAFTRYAVKPTVVNAPVATEQHYYSSYPSYKQVGGVQQPMSFYGYPLSQLHYSSGSVSPTSYFQQPSGSQSGPVGHYHQQQGSAEYHQQQQPSVGVAVQPMESAASEKSQSTANSPQMPVHHQQVDDHQKVHQKVLKSGTTQK